ncbi:MAG: phosphoesterase [Desulfurococcaceae archaeon]
MAAGLKKVLVLSDWDSDGVVAAALIDYVQRYLKKFPLEEEVELHKRPLDANGVKYLLSQVGEAYHTVVFLDVPYSDVLGNVVKMLKTHFGVKQVVFVDHHIGSLHKIDEVKKVFDIALVDYKRPTVAILYDELASRGIKVHEKLRLFVEVIRYMDSGKRVPEKLMKPFEIAKSISKALTAIRSEELWIKIVEWLSDPTPRPMPLDESAWSKAKDVIEKRDKEVKEVATRLAISAIKVGDFRFVDARSTWKKRGVTALASRLSAILKAPVALVAGTNREYALLILKAPGGRAFRIAKYLLAEGIAQDVAGHPNLAIVRIPKDLDKKQLIDALYHAIFYAS